MRLTGTKEYCVSQGPHWRDVGCARIAHSLQSPFFLPQLPRFFREIPIESLCDGCFVAGTCRFQGTNPLTDLRGVGMLGLHHLLWVSTTHCEKARQILVCTQYK